MAALATHLIIDLRAVDADRPDPAGEYALQLTAALVDLALHAEITVLGPGSEAPPPGPGWLLLPAGGSPLPGYRCLAWIHDLAPLTGGLRAFGARFRSAFAASRADLSLAPSEAVADALRRYLRVPSGRVAVVAPGLGPGAGRTSREEAEAARLRFGLPERYLLAAGDERVARRAWAAATIPAGAGLATLERLRPPREELPALLSGAVGLLLCQERAGNPIRALQAMACGTPPVVPDGGAHQELVRDGGLTIARDRPGDWAEAVSALFRSRPLRAQLSRRGRELAAELTAERAARRVLDLLDSRAHPGVDERVDARHLDGRD